MANPVPLPAQDPIAQPRDQRKYKYGEKDPNEGLITKSWSEYFTAGAAEQAASPRQISSEGLTGQSASIAATDMAPGSITGGLYRIQSYIRITQAASASSSVQLSLTWTDHGQAITLSLNAITGNTVTTTQSATTLIYSDAGAPITYAITYASVGATSAQYQMYLILEQLASLA